MDVSNNIPRHILTKYQLRYLSVKRAMDIMLSGSAILLLSPIWGVLALAIKIDSPGPILFKQQRVGKNKELFEIWKFRTMHINTPKDVPTHMLNNPDQYITRIGKFLRKTSLDELPQIFLIFIGKMSIVGPRPSLWNQNDLITERDKYGANDILPGLTGWAQINGRDELEIPVKAKFDGEYIKELGFFMDLKCFLGTIGAVLSSDGIIEGDSYEHKISKNKISAKTLTKEMSVGSIVAITLFLTFMGVISVLLKYKKNAGNNSQNKIRLSKKYFLSAILIEGVIIIYTNLKRKVQIKENRIDLFMNSQEYSNKNLPSKKILITGANSYVGMAVDNWLSKYPQTYQVDTLDMTNDSWKTYDFSSYDVVYHVAGIAHVDTEDVSEKSKDLYYKVNTDLAVETAIIAKTAGVKQFIFMSSMIIYSGCIDKIITLNTAPQAANFYGNSKLLADRIIQKLSDDTFKVVILRPPMIYGKGSKGNYPVLAKLSRRLPFFPIVNNRRSMLYIDNLCEFVKVIIDMEDSGVFFPQNKEYTNTSDLVQMIAQIYGHKIVMLPGLNWIIKLLKYIPGKIGYLSTKAFDDFIYEQSMSEYQTNYQIITLHQSIELTECEKT